MRHSASMNYELKYRVEGVPEIVYDDPLYIIWPCFLVFILPTDRWEAPKILLGNTRIFVTDCFYSTLQAEVWRVSLIHCSWEIWLKFQLSNFQAKLSNSWLRYLLWYYPHVIVTAPHWWLVNIGSGNGLVPSGHKPLREPMLTQISVAIWRH